MAPVYNAGEILRIAEYIEKNGAEYYRKAASVVQVPEAAKLFSDIARMEDDHALTFAGMLHRLQKSTNDSFSPVDDTGDEDTYLKNMASSYLFDNRGNPLEDMAGNPTPENILYYAVKKEQESVSFYLLMKESVPEILGKEWIDGIVNEELSHIKLLLEISEKFVS